MTATVGRDPTLSRGYRNKNPGNIDWNPNNKWQGQTGREAGVNGRFAAFDSHENGIRALAVLLITYQDRHKLNTIRGIVSRWAPAVENNTNSYIDVVAARTKRGPDEELDLHSYEHLRPLAEAIIHHELGGNPYPSAMIDEGLRRAGVVRSAPVTTKEALHTDTGKAAVGVGAAGVVAAISQAAPAIQALGALGPLVGIVIVLTAVALFVAWRRGRL